MRKLDTQQLQRLSVEEFEQKKKHNFVIVLDNVRSLHNVGSAFRTADAFAAQKVYLCGITGIPPNREIQKTALGATQTVAWQYAEHTTSLVEQLRKENYIILSIEQTESSILLQNYTIQSAQKYALVFGNEVFGVSQEVVNLSDACIEIPQFGTKHSLNVSVSIGIVCWQWLSAATT